MTNRKTTGALVSSVIALILCCAMLVGSTFAWFTDSASTAVNTIQSGTLKVDLVDANGASLKGQTLKFTNNYWEPGCTYELPAVFVKNNGNLALKYEIIINGISGNAKLLEAIEWTIKVDNQEVPLSALNGFLKGGDTSKALVISAHMKEEAGNEYQGLTIEGLGITVVATQYTLEKDSVDEKYDEDAQYELPVDTSWYDATASEYILYSVEDLAGFAKLVNEGNSFANKTVKLGANIDLKNIPWTPIGSFSYDRDGQTYANVVSFKGTFDGQGHTISNLKVNTPTTDGAGLFACAEAATIKNVKIHNVDIVASSHAAPILGRGYNYSKTTTVTNCHVTGNVSILIDWAYAGGIVAKATGLKISDCSVLPTGTGVITAANRNAVGGIVGWVETVGATTVANCKAANLNLTGWANIGAINGYIQAGCKIDGCSAENIVLTKTRQDGHPTIGLVSGGWSYNATQPVTITNNTVKNITLNGTHIEAPASADILYGAEFGGNGNSNFVLDNNTTTNVTNNLIEVKTIGTPAALKAAMADGGNYVLQNNLALTETITVPSGKTVTLYMNGKTIAGTFSNSGNQEMFLVKGNLTVKDGSFAMTATNNQGWSAMATIFDVTAGGVLNMEGVTANVGGTDMNFVVHLNNWGSATLKVDNCDFNLSYVAVRAFNSGYDMNTVTIKNTDVTGGARLFWVHNYTAEGKDASTLTLNIYGNNNTCENAKPVRFGFDGSTYYTLDGAQVVTAPITVAPAPLEEDFLFPAGTNAVIYKDMAMSGDAQITHTENAVLGLSNVTAELDHDVIIRKSAGAIVIENSEFTLTNGAKLISVGEGGDAYQVFMINVTINGVLMDNTTIRNYVEGVSYINIVSEWPNT